MNDYDNGGNNGGNNNKRNNGQMILVFIVTTLVALFAMSLISRMQSGATKKEISYSEFLDMVKSDSVESVEIGTYQIDITPKNTGDMVIPITYYTGVVRNDELLSLLLDHQVEVNGTIPDNTSS